MATQISALVNTLTVELIPKIVQVFVAWLNDASGFTGFLDKFAGLF